MSINSKNKICNFKSKINVYLYIYYEKGKKQIKCLLPWTACKQI